MDTTEAADAQDAATDVDHVDQQDDFADWRADLCKVEGLLVGRERRVGCAELLKLLDLDDLTPADRIMALTHVKAIMTSLGWKAKVTKIEGKAVRGYVRRDPKAPEPPEEEPAEVVSHPVLTPTEDAGPDALSQQLERVSGMALQQAEEILSKPLEGADGNLMRAKTAIVGSVLSTQSRVDENILRTKHNSDVLARLTKLLRQARKVVPKTPPRLELEGGR